MLEAAEGLEHERPDRGEVVAPSWTDHRGESQSADEESNTFNVGMSWLIQNRPDLRCDYALNESGGWLLPLADGRKLVTISIGEKRVSSIRLRFAEMTRFHIRAIESLT